MTIFILNQIIMYMNKTLNYSILANAQVSLWRQSHYKLTQTHT